jgi:hypothetical protein
MSREIIIAALIALFILIIAVLIAAVLKFKDVPAKSIISEKTKRETTLQDLLEIVRNKNSDKKELSEALKIFATSFKIPPKNGDKVSAEARAYLMFITILASHPKTDAKFIAFMNNELKKANPAYSSEIDVYEKEGVRKRA